MLTFDPVTNKQLS